MSVAKCMLVVSAAMCVQAVWEEHVGHAGMTGVPLKRVHENANTTMETCKATAEALGRTALMYRVEFPHICVVFTEGRDVVEDAFVADDDYVVAYFEEVEKEDDDSLSAGGVVATIVLAIFYFACLTVLALTCKHEEVDIAAQMDSLERKELEIAEAVSEHFERKSEEYERRSQQAEAKEMALVEKDEQ